MNRLLAEADRTTTCNMSQLLKHTQLTSQNHGQTGKPYRYINIYSILKPCDHRILSTSLCNAIAKFHRLAKFCTLNLVKKQIP